MKKISKTLPKILYTLEYSELLSRPNFLDIFWSFTNEECSMT